MMKNMEIKRAVLGEIETNCYLVCNRQSDELIIIDPAADAPAIKTWCDETGKTPAAILLTHGHYDHIGGADELRKMLGIKIYAYEGERELLGNPHYNLSGDWSSPITLEADEYFEDGAVLELAGFSIKVIHTPGHTSGGVSYYIEDEEVLFAGDTLFLDSYGRVDLPTSSLKDMSESINKKLFSLPDDTLVLPGHGDATMIGHEKRYNPLAER